MLFLFAVFDWLGVGVAVLLCMGLVHAFMQHLGFLPGVLTAGSGGEDDGSGAEEERGGFHEEGNPAILSGAARGANDNSGLVRNSARRHLFTLWQRLEHPDAKACGLIVDFFACHLPFACADRFATAANSSCRKRWPTCI